MWDDHGTRRRPPIAPLSHQLEDKERNVSSLFGAPNICGKPMASRAESVNAMRYLCGELTASTQSSDAPLLSHVFGEGPLVLSDIPLSCCQSSSGAAGETTGGVVAGIDEAGRGKSENRFNSIFIQQIDSCP